MNVHIGRFKDFQELPSLKYYKIDLFYIKNVGVTRYMTTLLCSRIIFHCAGSY